MLMNCQTSEELWDVLCQFFEPICCLYADQVIKKVSGVKGSAMLMQLYKLRMK